MCSLGIEPTTFRSADAMFYHWATQEHSRVSFLHQVRRVYLLSSEIETTDMTPGGRGTTLDRSPLAWRI